jgi:hypothetical protein
MQAGENANRPVRHSLISDDPLNETRVRSNFMGKILLAIIAIVSLSGAAFAQNAPPSSNKNCNTPQGEMPTTQAQAQSPRCEDQLPTPGTGIPAKAVENPSQATKTPTKGGQGDSQVGPGGAAPAQ